MAGSLFLLPFAAALALVPPQSVVSGVVLNAATEVPVGDANVALVGSALEAVSDSTGSFSLSGYDASEDTLIVTHPEFLDFRLLLGRDDQLPALRLMLTPRRVANPDSLTAVDDVQEMLERTGGILWEAQDFFQYAPVVEHPLELLAFSGFASSVSRVDGNICVVLRGDSDCAAVFVYRAADSGAPLRGRFPAEVDAFVIVMPQSTGPDARPTDQGGVIGVFLRNRDR